MRMMIKDGSRIYQIAELLADEVLEAKEQGENEGELWCAEQLLEAGEEEAVKVIKQARKRRILSKMLIEVR